MRKNKGFSTVELISVIVIIIILGALTYASGRNVSNNNNNLKGRLTLESVLLENKAISMKEDTYPLFPSNLIDKYESSKLSFTNLKSTDENVISVNQVSTSKVILTVVTGDFCWVVVDNNDNTPFWGLKKSSNNCLSSSVPYSTITSNDVDNPTEISF